MSSRPDHSKLAPRDLFSGLRKGSSSLSETILIRHFLAAERIIVLGMLIVTAVLVVRIMLTDPVINNRQTRIVKLETQLLEQVTSAVKARRQELPETVVGNRREYFTVRR